MAIKPYIEIQTEDYPEIRMFKWVSMQNGDTGTPIHLPIYSDKSVQVLGVFGAAGNCRIEGSNMDSSSSYTVLNDPQGNVLDITSTKIKVILENTYLIRPNITGGDATTNLDIYLIMK
jgi:hypothetical protein